MPIVETQPRAPRAAFIVGSSRSGTTMLQRILGANSHVAALTETHYFEECTPAGTITNGTRVASDEAARLLSRLMASQRLGYFRRYETARFLGAAARLLKEAEDNISHPVWSYGDVFRLFMNSEGATCGAELVVEQTPSHIFYLREIFNIYPQAKVIVMVRDPRSVLFSQKKKWRRRYNGAGNIPRMEALRAWLNYHPITVSLLWRAAYRSVSGMDGDRRIKFLQYEQLVRSPETCVRTVCDFLGLEFESRMLEVPKAGSSHSNDLKAYGIRSEASRTTWARGLSSSEIGICQGLLGDQMASFGYTMADVHPSLLGKVILTATFPLKTGLALIVNFRRSRSLLSSIARRCSAIWKSHGSV